MYEENTRKLFAKYAIPQMIGLLFNSIYMIVDGMFIGNILGRDSMAAAAVAVPLIEILIALSMAIASGAGVMISGQSARCEKEKALRTFDSAIVCASALGLLVVTMGNALLQPLTRLLGATPQIQQEAVEYIRYIVSFSPFLIFSFLLSGLVRNDGNPKLAMLALAFGSVSNIVLDYVFMCPLNMGIGGAALATAVGPVFSVLILLPHFFLKKGNLHFTWPKPCLADIRRIFILGFPSFIMEFTIGIITFIYNLAIVKNGYGEIGLAAYLLIGYLMLIVLTFFLGMAEGLQPVFSYFNGAGLGKRSQEMHRFSAKVFLAFGIYCYGLILLFSRQFFAMFNPEDAALIGFSAEKSVRYFCGFFLAGYNILMISFWQSIQHTRRALVISLCRSLIWPPVLIALLPGFFGSDVIWLCHSFSEALTAGIAALLLMRDRALQ